MSVTNLKARPKAAADRISEDIYRAIIIRGKAIASNQLRHCAAPETVAETLGASVPLEFWLANKDELLARGGTTAVQIAADQSPVDLADDLDKIDCIVLPLVAGVDGRPYSHAYRLRTQLKYTGEIRATGDIKHDTLGFLRRVGVSAFELSEGQDLEAALYAFSDFSDVYQPSADDGQLIFARRRMSH